MDLDDEELKATRMMNGADRKGRVNKMEQDINENIKILEESIIQGKYHLYKKDLKKCVSNVIKAYKELEEKNKKKSIEIICYQEELENSIPVSLVEEKILNPMKEEHDKAIKGFIKRDIPPKNNANFAFILTGLEKCDRCVFIMPQSILVSEKKEEINIRKYLVEKNFIEGIITCPGKMFEATSIPVCILILNKNKNTTKIALIDATNFCEKEIREQCGQFGGKTHENRIYKKEINVFSDEQIEELNKFVRDKIEKKDLSKIVGIEDIKLNNYNLNPRIYFELNFDNIENTRNYEDIINDLNRIIKQKNCLKLTINEKIAKSIGIYEVAKNMKKSEELNNEINESLKEIKDVELKIEKENFISLSKNKNEIKFENNSKEFLSEILMLILHDWKTMIYHLNNEENRYLFELKDKLLNDLMGGRLDIK